MRNLSRRSAPPTRAVVHHVVQGEQRISGDPEAMFTTILGSCVAACLRDPVAGIGGMNHFLLPGDIGMHDEAAEMRLGVHAMELLINALMTHGASRRRLEAKVFGGAQLRIGLTDVGTLNGVFAKQFLDREGIRIVGGCVGGVLGRRVQFWPVSGRARRIFLQPCDFVAPPPAPVPVHAPDVSTGSLELF